MTTIAVIGTGNVGGALGAAARQGGVRRRVRRPGRREDARGGRGRRRDRRRDAARGRRRSPTSSCSPSRTRRFADVAAEIAPVADGKIVIDPSNPLKPDYSGLATAGGLVRRRAARRASSRTSKVVKAFNTLFAGNRPNPEALGIQLDSLFATDDEAAKDAVCGLSASIGFRPIHVGPLAASRELEAMAWLNIRLQMVSDGNWNTAFALVVAARGGAHLRQVGLAVGPAVAAPRVAAAGTPRMTRHDR